MNGIMKRILSSLMLIVICCFFSGCLTTPASSRRAAREREDFLILQEDMRQLSGRMESMELELDRIQNDLDYMRSQQKNSEDANIKYMQSKLAEYDNRLSRMSTANEKDKKEIIDKLSKQIAEILKTKSSSRTGNRQNRRAGSGYGYEHEVQPGETLSAIAAAYGVTTRAIIEANDIKNANMLNVGQKLFIPE